MITTGKTVTCESCMRLWVHKRTNRCTMPKTSKIFKQPTPNKLKELEDE